MTDKRWEDIKGLIEERFGFLDLREEKIVVGEDEKGRPVEGVVEIVEFKTPQGKFKLERTTKPAIVDKKVLSSRRIGAEKNIVYIYSQEEVIKTFKAYRWQEERGEWEEIKPDFLEES